MTGGKQCSNFIRTGIFAVTVYRQDVFPDDELVQLESGLVFVSECDQWMYYPAL